MVRICPFIRFGEGLKYILGVFFCPSVFPIGFGFLAW